MSLSAPSSNASLRPHLVLTLCPDDPSNTALCLPSGAVLYSARTDAASGETRVVRMRGVSSSGVRRRPKLVATRLAGDTVVCGERRPVLVRDWLRVQTLCAR